MYAIATREVLDDLFTDQPDDREATKAQEDASGVVQRLKDEFGDYSDPLMYDWSWRETD